MNKRLLPIAVTLSLVLSFLLAIPATANTEGPPLPEELWSYNTTADVTDIAIGDLKNKDGKDDVVAIDNLVETQDTLHAISGGGPADWQWQKPSLAGYAVAVGDINGDGWNEVIAGGWENAADSKAGANSEEGFSNTVIGNSMINAYDKNGNPLWSYPVEGEVKDIEIGDVDGDTINDIVACNSVASHIYAIDGTGDDVTGQWPITSTPTPIVDLAVGQLDGEDGVDVAAIGWAVGCLYVYDSTGVEMWRDEDVDGRAVEIGDVDGDGDNEVVAITYDSKYAYDGGGTPTPTPIPGGWVLAFDGTGDGAGGSTLLYSFYTEDWKIISDIELGDLDGNPEDVEVAAITEPVNTTLFAIDIDNPTDQEMWRYNIDWPPQYYGESLAIGDVDRDYKNEVVAATSAPDHCIYAFDALDKDGDGEGDLVWSPYCVWESITDVEVGDLDGDGDDDVAFGTVGGKTVYAVTAVESQTETATGIGIVGGGTVYAITAVESQTETATGTGTVYFDADPSILENLTPVDESDLPEEGKPALEFPHGFFSFDITLPEGHKKAIVTITFPSPVPEGAQYWKYHEPEGWINVTSLLGDDDGDNVLTLALTDGGLGDDDGEKNGVILDQGAPGFPRPAPPVGGEAYPVNKLAILAPWIALAVAIIAVVTILVRRRRT